ncbi:MAG: iron-containing alcohol dehydrogenase [Nanobdellota archaeon]
MLRKYLTPEIVFGQDSRHMASQYIINIGLNKPLIVTDEGIINAGWLGELKGILSSSGIAYQIFSDVRVNPTEKNVIDGVKTFENSCCDGIVALGGGSVIDCSKAIGIMVSNPGSIFDYKGVDKIEHPSPPLISMPTTAGSAADVSQFAIIRDSEKKVKYAIVSKMLVSDVSLVDPDYLMTLDIENTLFTGLDTLSHGIESLLSTGSSRLTRLHSKEAISVVKKFLPKCISDPQNLDYRENVLYATLVAGFAFSNASLGLLHAISHSLGGYTDEIHGLLNSCLLKEVLRFNYKNGSGFDDLAIALGTSNDIENIISQIDSLFEAVGFNPLSMAQLNLDEGTLERIAADSLNDPCMITNPLEITKQQVIAIIKKSFS